MKKLIFIAVFFLAFISNCWSGQDPLYSQFMTNQFLINPALTGTFPYYQIITNNRVQWVGFADAPITNTISLYGPMVHHPMGIGAYISHDAFGIESKISACGTYAYNFSLNEEMNFSMGLMLGVFQHRIGGDVRIKETNDIIQENEIYQNYKPDASIGMYLYTLNYHIGIAMTNMFGNKLQFEELEDDTIQISVFSRIRQHYYIHAGYKHFFNHELAIEPNIIVRKVTSIPFQVDVNVRIWYGRRAWDGNKLWGGLSYRTDDAISVIFGFVYNRKIDVGYSYDIGLNDLSSYHSGSHELMVLYRFNEVKKY